MFADVLAERLAGVARLTDGQVRALVGHYELLLKWNRVLNLTRIEDEAEAAERHYCESVFAGVHIAAGEWRIVDVGSGAGFPGVPIAVVRPECGVTLVESHQRKAVFLREASRGMGNVRVVAGRAEAVKDEFDWVVSRAVSYADLKGCAARLGRSVALLSGAEEPPAGMGMEWDEAVRLPWGKQRFLRVGRRG